MVSKSTSKTLVIDTNIFRASAESDDDLAAFLANALNTLFIKSFYWASNQTAEDEFQNHASKFSIKWKAKMERKGLVKVLLLGSDYADYFNRQVLHYQSSLSKNDFDEILKDAHLFDLARSCDRIICSLDAKLITRIKKYPILFNYLQGLLYCNLSDAGTQEQLIPWLEANCSTSEITNWLEG